MLTIDSLNRFGANTREGLDRCMNNEAFYLRMVNMALADRAFDRLAAALEAGETQTAFEAAHSLKGVLANLALTPLCEPTAQLTEQLRRGEAGDPSLLEQLLRLRDALRNLDVDA